MNSLSQLPEINFAEKSAQEIETAVITTYEAISERTLAPGDPVRLFLEAIAVLIIQQRALIDYSAKQNLLAYSTGDYLDHIGILVGSTRLPAAKAKTTLRFILSAAQPQSVTISAGTRATPGNNLYFATTAVATIPAGQTTIDVSAECTETGTKGNGYQPGQINKIVDPFQWLKTVSNITQSEGGAETETDASYRERIRQAPEQFSCAGPVGAYRYWAKTASQQIIDVAVYSPAAGTVEIRPLLTDGAIPGQDILDTVAQICNNESVRPLTDLVSVLAPEIVSYNIDMTYYIAPENSTQTVVIQQAVTQAVNDYILWQKTKIGRSINPSELVTRVRTAGASRIDLITPIYLTLTAAQVAVVGTVTVNYGGLGDG